MIDAALPAVGDAETLPRPARDERAAAAPFTLITGLGAGALLMGVLSAAWLAIGAADGRYLLELPSHTHPDWIDGPLRILTAGLGSLTPAGLSFGLAALGAAYAVALACAGSIPLRRALAAVVLANLAFTLGPSLVSSDVFGYIAYAREAALHGLNPYVSAPAALAHDGILHYVYWRHQPSPYGPLFTAASLPLGLVSAGAALWCLKAAAGLASVAIVFMVADIARSRGLNPARAVIFVGLNPVLLFYAVSGAHNDLLAVALVVTALALAIRHHEGWGAAAIVGAAAVKITLGLALPFLLIAARDRRRPALRGATLAIAAIALATLALFGGHFLDQVHRISTDRLFDTAFSGPDRVAAALGTGIGPAIRLSLTAAAGLTALAMLLRAWRGADAVAACGWAFLALLASIASLAPWYLVWLLPLAALGRSRPLRALTLVATAYLIAVHLPALGAHPWLSAAGGAAAQAPMP